MRCRHHLYLDVEVRRAHGKVLPKVRLNYPDVEVEDLEHSCALDVADDGPKTLEQVAEVLWVTRERARQIEQAALAKLRHAMGEVFVGDDELVAMLARMVARDDREGG